MSLWENDETIREQRLQRIIVISAGVIALCFVIGVARFAATRLMHPGNGIGFANVERERDLEYTDPVDGTRISATPVRTAMVYSTNNAFVRRPRTTPLAFGAPLGGARSAPVVVPNTITSVPVLNESERLQTESALESLRETYNAVKDYDRHSFWHGAITGPTSRPVESAPYTSSQNLNTLPRPGSPVNNSTFSSPGSAGADFAPGGGVNQPARSTTYSASGFGGGSVGFSAAPAVVSPINGYQPAPAPPQTGVMGSRENIDDVDTATNALGSLVSLYGHPDRFPGPVRGDAGEASKAMRDYLVITAGVADSGSVDEVSLYRPAAQKRLADSDAALRRIESALTATIPIGSPTGYSQ